MEKILHHQVKTASSQSSPRKITGVVKSALNFRKQVQVVHQAISSSWICGCKGGHRCGILLERRLRATYSSDSKLTLVFEIPTGLRRTNIRLTKVSKSTISGTGPGASSTGPHITEQLRSLRTQTTARSASRSKVKKTLQKYSITRGALSILPIPSLRFNQDQPPVAVNPKYVEDTRTAQALLRLPSTTPAQSPAKSIRFAINSPNESDSQLPSSAQIPIVDLCTALRESNCDEYLGCLDLGTIDRLVFHAPKDDILSRQAFVTRSILQLLAEPVKKAERIHLASTCAHMFLSLHGTPWTVAPLTKETVSVVESRTQSGDQEMNAFVFQTFKQSNVSSALSSTWNQSMFALGVLILELLFGESLEQQPFRTKYLSDGQPNRFTDLCTAKEWCERAALEFGDKLSNAVEICIDEGVKTSSSSLSEELLQSFYDDVIQPLDQFLALFSGSIKDY